MIGPESRRRGAGAGPAARPLGAPGPLFDDAFLAAVRAIHRAAARRRVVRPRPAAGAAIGVTREVRDRRRYAPGDDIRAVDWPVYARLERLFVRLYEEVREVRVDILLDVSRSMALPYATKRAALLRLAGGLAAAALAARHRVQLHPFAAGLGRAIGPLRGAGQARPLLERLAAVTFAGATDLASAARGFRPARAHRGAVVILSDLLGDGIDPALDRAARWACETQVVHVVDPREIDPALDPDLAERARGSSGAVDLVDAESGRTRRLALGEGALARARDAAEARAKGIRHAIERRGLGYVLARTDRPLADALRPLCRGW